MTEQTESLSATGALDAVVDAAVVVALTDYVDSGTASSAATAHPPNCLNCGALVRGRYCIDCGQVTDTHVPTLSEVLGDALTSVFNLDSRLWRTLGALLLAPGKLTQEFLAGKRARYVPPVRLYLVMSVLFFLLASLDGSNNDEDGEDDITQTVADAIVADPNAAVSAAMDVADLNADPDLDLGPGVNFSRDAVGNVTITDAAGIRVELNGTQSCEEMDTPFESGGALDSAIREACLDGVEDDYASLKDAFADNVPLLAFLVIPVMAAVFKIFYVFTGRAYIGHLVFLCHTHAYTFLLIVLLLLLRMLGSFSEGLSSVLSILGYTLLLLYTPAYYFIAMRRVYAQHWALTFVKLMTLMLIYVVAILTVFSVGFIVLMLVN